MQYEGNEYTEEIEGSRHIDLHNVFRKNIAAYKDRVGLDHDKGFIDTDIRPYTVIQLKQEKHHDGDDTPYRHNTKVSPEILIRDLSELHVETDPKCGKIGEHHHGKIGQNNNDRMGDPFQIKLVTPLFLIVNSLFFVHILFSLVCVPQIAYCYYNNTNLSCVRIVIYNHTCVNHMQYAHISQFFHPAFSNFEQKCQKLSCFPVIFASENCYYG